MSSERILSFAEFGLSGAIVRAVDEVGYETPSPIQSAAIVALLEGRDILGQAQTGTGKTAAFALPLLSRLDLSRRQPQILVLTPTRELAIQVAEALQTYARHLPGFHVLPVYGGQSMGLQLRPLRRGVHAVVGTPGRILDHLRRRTLVLDSLAAVVLDEADEMLRMGFIDDVGAILEQTPAEKQLALFSATMPEPIRAIARRHTRDPVEVRIETRTATVSTVSQRYWQVSGVHKLDALTRILEVEDFNAMLIFVRTKTATTELAERLEARGLSSAPLNGDMNQQAREQTIERLKSGRLDILVATDVAARGLDVQRISHVVNYDIPHDTEAYVHRIGRTARAGRKGEAIMFVAPRERRMLRAIEKAIGQTIAPMTIPSHEDVADKRTARFKAKISDVIDSQDLAVFESLVTSYQGEHNADLTEVAAALAFMADGGQLAKPPRKPVKRKETAGVAKTVAKRPLKPATPTVAVEETAETVVRPRRAKLAESQRDEKPARKKTNKLSSVIQSTPPRSSRQRSADPTNPRYRIAVGASHGLEPKDIVGVIADEAGLDSEYIGSINIFDEYSTVELPHGMPREVLKHLKNVWVCGRRLMIELESNIGPGTGRALTRKRELKPDKEIQRRATSKAAKKRKPRTGSSPQKPGRPKHKDNRKFKNTFVK